MDKELIVSYRRSTANTEPGDANQCFLFSGAFGYWGVRGLGSEPVLGKRINRGDTVW